MGESAGAKRAHTPEGRGWSAALYAWALAGLIGLLIATTAAKTPDPKAPPGRDGFDVARALKDIAVMAREPHPVGSEPNRRVRDYLSQRMTGLGLEPRIQSAVGARPITRFRKATLAAPVENLIGVLKGRDPHLPALMILAHYDSVPLSPGAADDAAGTATALEIARLIGERGQPERDVIIAITDGEEAGLLGAQALFDDPQIRARTGYVINMEARGGGGRASMFETGFASAGSVAVFAREAVRPAGNSLTTYVYHRMPNDTDFSVSRELGVPGLNFAFIDRESQYHSPTSTLAHLDAGSVRHMGEQAAPAALAVAFSKTLPAAGPDPVYSDVFGLGVIAYGPIVGWLVLAVALGLWILVAARNGGAPVVADVWRGALAGLLVITLSALAMQAVRAFTGAGADYRAIMVRFSTYELAMGLAGAGAAALVVAGLGRGGQRWLVAGLALALGLATWLQPGVEPRLAPVVLAAVSAVLGLIVMGRPVHGPGLGMGLALLGLILGAALQALAPTTAYWIVWPMIVAALLALLQTIPIPFAPARTAISIAILAILFAWLFSQSHFLLLALDRPELPALCALLLAIGLAAGLDDRTSEGRAPAAAAPITLLVLAGGLAVALFMRVTPAYSPGRPAQPQVFYVVEADKGLAWRAALLEPRGWARNAVLSDGGKVETRRFEGFPFPVFAAKARFAPEPAPGLALARTQDGAYALTVTPAPGTRRIQVSMTPSVGLADPQVFGKPAPGLTRAGEKTELHWIGSDQPFVLRFAGPAKGAIEVGYLQTRDEWPRAAAPLPPMPADSVRAQFAGSTLVIGSKRLSWEPDAR